MSEVSFPVRVRRLVPRLIGLVFGGLWASTAALTLPRSYRALGIACDVLILAGFVVRVWRGTSDEPAQKKFFRSRAYLLSVAAEVAAIWVASFLLARFGLSDYLYSATGFIVGLHFIGLWWASGSRRFLSICAGMCVVSLVSAVVPFRWGMLELRYVALGIGNALVLWIGASGTEL